jgi:UDPglucose 6-dehydrogenase
VRLADGVGSDVGVVEAWIANSAHRKGWAYRELKRSLYADDPDATLGILGLAYKQDTHSTKNSPSLALLEKVKDRPVTVYDPVVKGCVAPFARDAESALDACEGSDAVAIMTPWTEFKELDPKAIAQAMRGRILLDPFGVLSADAARAAGLDYRTLGVGPTG